MKRCPYCYHSSGDASFCPRCGHIKEIPSQNEKEFILATKKRLQESHSRIDNGKAYIIISIIFFSISSILCLMANKFNQFKEKVFRFDSIEFRTACFFAVLGILALSFGLYRLIQGEKEKKFYQKITRG